LDGQETEAWGAGVDDESVLPDTDTWKDCRRFPSYRDRERIPDQKRCMELLDEAGVEASVRDHCRLVAVVACRLVRLLNDAGAGLDEELVRAAALLHDIRRHEKDHALAGAMLIKTCGYVRVAEIVAAHMDMESVEAEFPTETEVVYVADKFVMGRHCVPLEERFAVALERHRGNANIITSILRRKEQAERIKKKVERSIGCTLEEIIFADSTDPVKDNPREA